MLQQAAGSDILFENHYLRLYFDPVFTGLVIEWKQEVSTLEFRDSMEKFLQVLAQQTAHYSSDFHVKLLCDVRKVGPQAFDRENIQWLEQKVHRAYIEYGVTRHAFIKSENQETNLCIIQYISQANMNRSFTMNIVRDYQTAYRWMNS